MNATSRKARRKRINLGLMALEPRWMFDGAAMADAAHAAPDAAAKALIPDAPAPVQVRAADPSKDGGKKEVVFIDTSVTGYKTLEAAVKPGIEIEEIDGGQSGLAQMAKWAETHTGYDSISLLSHGAEATILAGTDVITDASLSDPVVQAELAEIGSALKAGGDLLVFGCDVAKGADGQQFITDLAADTGADVGASTDATGAADLGGNWTLEAHSGTALDGSPINVVDAAAWDNLLITKTWQKLIDSSSIVNTNTASYDSVVVASDGTVYFAYSRSSDQKEVVIKYDPNAGTTTVLGSVGDAAVGNATVSGQLSIASDGTLYFAYINTNTNKISVNKWNGSSWVAVGSAGFSGIAYYGSNYTMSFALDNTGSGTPYVAYVNDSGQTTVMEYTASAWTALGGEGGASTSTAVTSASNLSLAISSTTHTPYLSCQDQSNGNAAILNYSSGAWTVVRTALDGTSTSLAISSTGAIYLDASGSSGGALYSVNGSTITQIGGSISGERGNHLAIAQNGDVYLSYQDAANKLNLGVYQGGTTYASRSAPYANAINSLSLAVDSNGNPYVAYTPSTGSGQYGFVYEYAQAPISISGVTYNVSTGILDVAGTNLTTSAADYTAADITLTGLGSGTWTLHSDTVVSGTPNSSDVKFLLSAQDQTGVDALFNVNGTKATDNVNYNFAGTLNWDSGARAVTTEGVTVSGLPAITTATYKSTTGKLTLVGTNLTTSAGDFDPSKFTLTGDTGTTRALTGSTVEANPTSTQVVIDLNAATFNALLDQNGLVAANNSTTYNLAYTAGWDSVRSGANSTLGVTVVGYAPTITSASYDASTGKLTVTGSNFSAGTSDYLLSKYTLLGEGTTSYALTGGTVESGPTASHMVIDLSAADQLAVDGLLNKTGTASQGGTTYNLSTTAGWDTGGLAVTTAAVTVSNPLVPTITSVAYNGT